MLMLSILVKVRCRKKDFLSLSFIVKFSIFTDDYWDSENCSSEGDDEDDDE